MERVTKIWLLLPRRVRQVPLDLAAVIGLVVLTALATTLPGLRGSVVRVLFGAAFVLFVPGYAITAALFPKSGAADERRTQSPAGIDQSDAGVGPISREGITLPERVLFSFGSSVIVVPLVGFALNFTPVGIQFTSLMLSVGGLTVAAALFAVVRRWEIPAEERFRVPVDEWYSAARSALFESRSGLEAALNAVILLSTLVALGSGAYAVVGPQESQSFTEFYLLGENETGDPVADAYPETIAANGNGTVVVGISNHEHRTTEYVVVARLQRVQTEGNSSTVTETRRVDRFRVTVEDDGTVHRRHTVQPELAGERLRLQYLLYVDEPPADPSAGNAYRNAHVWVNVTNQ